MINVILFALLTLALLGALYWLSHRIKGSRDAANVLQAISAEKLLPQNYKYFPQVRQALSKEDEEYLESRVGTNARRMALSVRRNIARDFLAGLRDDHRRLDRLARALTAVAPALNQELEFARIRLALRFEFLWALVWLRLWMGATPVTQIQQLAEFIGSLAVRTGASMDALQRAADAQSSQLNA
jgi:hypothetical protein